MTSSFGCESTKIQCYNVEINKCDFNPHVPLLNLCIEFPHEK